MTITARYPGRCSRCGYSIREGDRIEWDPSTRKTWHAECHNGPAYRPAAKTQPSEPNVPKGRNRRPGSCEACGQYLKPGEGRLVYCPEDNGCPKHHDHDGYHLYCADEAACKARREAAKQAAARRREITEALMATVGAQVEAPQGLRRIAQYGGGGASLYGASYFATDGDRVYYQRWEMNPSDSFDLITYATTATVEQVEAAVQSGVLARSDLDPDVMAVYRFLKSAADDEYV